MKIKAPPKENELSFSTGTFLNNYDVINRKVETVVIGSTVEKEQKTTSDTIVETTKLSQ